MKDVIIFDFDGTLADSIGVAIRLYNELAPQYKSLPVHPSEIPQLRKMGYTKAMKAKHIHWPMLPRMVLQLSKQMKLHISEVQPYPGIVDLLHQLRQEGKTLGILTSNEADIVQAFFDTHKLPAFDFVVSERTLFGKDKALRKILRKYAIAKERVVYIGDEPRDVLACRRLALPVIGVSWGLAGTEGFGTSPPDMLVHTAVELADAIKSI